MGSGRCPGPFGIGIVPMPWLDAGTLCLDASPLPGPWLVVPPVAADYTEDEIALAALAYGEGSTGDIEDEMSGIAQVFARQVKARGHKSVKVFLSTEKSYAFAASDGNPRYARFQKSTPAERAAAAGMASALRVARAASSGGADPSAGAYFWDGVDLKSNAANHPKVKAGIHFTDNAHDIFKLGNRHLDKEKVEYWLDAKGKATTKERGRYQWRYESTAAHGLTVFWRLNADFMKATGNAAHK